MSFDAANRTLAGKSYQNSGENHDVLTVKVASEACTNGLILGHLIPCFVFFLQRFIRDRNTFVHSWTAREYLSLLNCSHCVCVRARARALITAGRRNVNDTI